MVYKTHTPSGFLSKYLKEIVYIKDYYPEHFMDKYLPDGTINIVFELSNTSKYIYDNFSNEEKQKCSQVWFSGVLKEYITISSHAEEMIVVVFHPGACYPLTHNNANLFTDKVVSAVDVFGMTIIDLYTNLKTSNLLDDKFYKIENWLSNQLIDDDFYTNIIRTAIDYICSTSSKVSISNLALESGFSQKQFIQLFRKYVGITPKQLHRIMRFNDILSNIKKNEKVSWTAIALDCGYFDQAHFIKDFKSFSGLNPKKYLKDIGDYPNYFPVK